MREPENIIQVAALDPDYMGFIFYPGSRRYAGNIDASIMRRIPKNIKKTGVFVNSPFGDISAAMKKYQLQAVQLHGNESPELCAALKKEGAELIKAFGVDEGFDFEILEDYVDSTDHFLFDTKTSSHGGSGRTFSWELLKGYKHQTSYFLSGGLSLENLENIQLIEDKRLYAIDINSKFESEPGVKEIEKVKEAISYIRLNHK